MYEERTYLDPNNVKAKCHPKILRSTLSYNLMLDFTDLQGDGRWEKETRSDL